MIVGTLLRAVGLHPRSLKIKANNALVTAEIVDEDETTYTIEQPLMIAWWSFIPIFKYTVEKIDKDDIRIMSVEPPRQKLWGEWLRFP